MKIAAGNPGKRKINKNEPEPKGEPSQPVIMTAMAKKIWTRLVHSMPAGIFTNCDSALLAAYSEAVANHMQATSVIAAGAPLMIKGSTGQEIVNPIFAHQEKQGRFIITAGQRLGLDPAARQSLTIPESTEVDEFDGLIN